MAKNTNSDRRKGSVSGKSSETHKTVSRATVKTSTISPKDEERKQLTLRVFAMAYEDHNKKKG